MRGSDIGAAYGTAKCGVGLASMGVMKPQLGASGAQVLLKRAFIPLLSALIVRCFVFANTRFRPPSPPPSPSLRPASSHEKHHSCRHGRDYRHLRTDCGHYPPGCYHAPNRRQHQILLVQWLRVSGVRAVLRHLVRCFVVIVIAAVSPACPPKYVLHFEPPATYVTLESPPRLACIHTHLPTYAPYPHKRT